MNESAAGSGGDKNWALVLVVPACAVLFILFVIFTLTNCRQVPELGSFFCSKDAYFPIFFF